MALHLDHGDSFELAKDCIDSGFSSVMLDGSHHSFDENVRLTKTVVEYAHARDVTVEGELGVLAGVEDEVSSTVSHYTKPEEVEEFVGKTGVDSLAISIGTSHGAYKFKLKPGEEVPSLRFDILEAIEKRLPGYPIVLHGASSVTPEHVALINRYGGNLESAVGIPAEQLRRAARSAVCKINIDSDGRLAMTAMIRQVFAEKPAEFDPRKYLGPARDELVKMVKHKNINVLGSADQHSSLNIHHGCCIIGINIGKGKRRVSQHENEKGFRVDHGGWTRVAAVSLNQVAGQTSRALGGKISPDRYSHQQLPACRYR
jgi:fructose-bisphosphate aldolase class II